MNQKWNLQDIRPANRHPKQRELSNNRGLDLADDVDNEVEQTARVPIENGNKKKKKSWLLFILTALVFVVGIVLISILMRGADVVVYPKVQQPNLNTVITSYVDINEGELRHEVMSLKAVAEDQLEAEGEIEEETIAKGRITVYNENSFAQRLVANTRFESPEGNIYRTNDEVNIPPASGAGAETIPGSVTIDIVADDFGENYNIEDTVRFSIPGFAEGGFDDLYQTVYAENPTAITGGFSGKRFKVDDEDRKIARQKLQMQLRQQLLDEVKSNKLAGMTYYDDSIIFLFQELPAVEYRDGMVTIKEQATLQVPLFKMNDLAEYIARATISEYSGEDVRIDNDIELNFVYENNINDEQDLTQLDSISFTLTGRPRVVWNISEEELKNELASQHKDSLNSILNNFPGIDKAEVKIRPFWQQRFPSDQSFISIKEVFE